MVNREKKIMQQQCFAIKACYDMHKTTSEASACLAIDEETIKVVYRWIDKNMIDFDSPFSE